jgi:hypothetical protein
VETCFARTARINQKILAFIAFCVRASCSDDHLAFSLAFPTKCRGLPFRILSALLLTTFPLKCSVRLHKTGKMTLSYSFAGGVLRKAGRSTIVNKYSHEATASLFATIPRPLPSHTTINVLPDRYYNRQKRRFPSCL